jgi:hypothetical protein
MYYSTVTVTVTISTFIAEATYQVVYDVTGWDSTNGRPTGFTILAYRNITKEKEDA